MLFVSGRVWSFIQPPSLVFASRAEVPVAPAMGVNSSSRRPRVCVMATVGNPKAVERSGRRRRELGSWAKECCGIRPGVVWVAGEAKRFEGVFFWEHEIYTTLAEVLYEQNAP